MQQQQQILPDWQSRLWERLASPAWKDTDSVLANLPPVEAIQILQTLLANDHKRLHWYWLVNISGSLLQVGLPTFLVLWILQSLSLPFWGYPLLGSLFGMVIMLLPRPGKLSLERSCTRCRNAYSTIQRLLPKCHSPEAIPVLLSFLEAAQKTHRPLHQDLEWAIQKAIRQILIRLGSEDIFALPFALRRELAHRAEQPDISPDLAIAILLALTSARDGLIQPVLRRLASDAWSSHLKQVAAECLQEFNKESES